MAINLKKGSSINLTKEKKQSSLDKLQICLGWSPETSIFGKKWDLDAAAILLVDGKLKSEGDIIYYGHKNHSSGDIWCGEDNRTGEGEGDDEFITANLTSLDNKYTSVLFFVTIYEGHSKNQSFGKVKKAYIRAVESSGNEIARFDLSEEKSIADKCTVVFAEAVRDNSGEWEFKAIGDGFDEDHISKFVKRYAK